MTRPWPLKRIPSTFLHTVLKPHLVSPLFQRQAIFRPSLEFSS
eukprot:CAMPEP_0195283438 /NCGR_PEP_ID=MMETSP0707-20130614/1988_1 /TAXON_ID=33640 /ORGANISM="Asterionellopsis glacialis, Strain CCMP134" /LENGTH=42 /DNA_ID= /DNA_START= /DNA_END= /DNA_ORIENTATION=